jgi:hypothetical protein
MFDKNNGSIWFHDGTTFHCLAADSNRLFMKVTMKLNPDYYKENFSNKRLQEK